MTSDPDGAAAPGGVSSVWNPWVSSAARVPKPAVAAAELLSKAAGACHSKGKEGTGTSRRDSKHCSGQLNGTLVT